MLTTRTCLKLRSIAIAVIAWTLVAGCAGMQGQKPNAEDLESTVEAFNSSIRWGDFRAASAMIPEKAQNAFWEDAEVFTRDTRIANMEIRAVKVEDLSGTAHISFTYYRLNDPSFRTLVLHQKWHFDQDRHAWLIDDPQLYRMLP